MPLTKIVIYIQVISSIAPYLGLTEQSIGSIEKYSISLHFRMHKTLSLSYFIN